MNHPGHDWRHVAYYAGRDAWRCARCAAYLIEGEDEPAACPRVTVQVITPHNAASLRGWSGHIIIDEIGPWPKGGA